MGLASNSAISKYTQLVFFCCVMEKLFILQSMSNLDNLVLSTELIM